MFNRTAVTLAAVLCMGELAYGQATAPPATEPQGPPPSTAPAEATATDKTDAVLGYGCPALGNDPTRWWGSADYLLGWTRGARLPPLVTTSVA